MLDLCCDDDMTAFYEKFGMMKGNAMIKRNYDRQSGEKEVGEICFRP